MSKTENNLKNKAAFFAQYYKQKVMRCYTPTSVSEIMYVDPVAAGNYEYFLELTPLSQISEEDAIEVFKILFPNHSFLLEGKENIIGIIDIVGDWCSMLNKESGGYLPKNYITFIDYLQAKGYALPWRDLSVDDLIEYGWVKLKTE